MKNPSVHALAAAGILQQLVDGPSEAHLPNVSAAVGRGWANHTARGYEITAEGLQVLLAVREHQLREGLKRYEAVADAIAAKLLGEIQALDVFNPKWLPAGRPYTYARETPLPESFRGAQQVIDRLACDAARAAAHGHHELAAYVNPEQPLSLWLAAERTA